MAPVPGAQVSLRNDGPASNTRKFVTPDKISERETKYGTNKKGKGLSFSNQWVKMEDYASV